VAERPQPPAGIATVQPDPAAAVVGAPLDPAALRAKRTGPRWVGVAASPVSPSRLGVWSERVVSVSEDHGRTWSRLSGTGRVHAVAMAGDGTVWVARGSTLTVHLPDGTVRRVSRTGVGKTLALAVGRGVVAWAVEARDGLAELLVSRDGGLAFEPVEGASPGNYENRLLVLGDGTVLFYAHTELSCGGGSEQVFRVPAGTLATVDAFPHAPPTYLWGLDLGAGGALLAVEEEIALHRGFLTITAPGSQTGRRVTEFTGGVWRYSAAIEGDRTLVALDRRLLEVSTRAERELDSAVPEGFELRALDAASRPLGLLGGRLVRRDPDAVWRILAAR